MVKRKNKAYQNIKNLGAHAQKKRRISDNVPDGVKDKENVQQILNHVSAVHANAERVSDTCPYPGAGH